MGSILGKFSGNARAASSASKLRFNIGDRVACITAEGWSLGQVVALHYREDDWPQEKPPAPYQVKLETGDLIYAPSDDASLIRAAGQQPTEPWHVREARRLSQADIAKLYPPKALHQELFDPVVAASGRWFVPDLAAALAEWKASGDVSTIDVEKLPGVKLEAPGIISFDCLTHEYCDMLLAEAKHYQNTGFPQRAPNSMNNYGLVLNEIGMRPAFDMLLKTFIVGIGSRFFGDFSTRATSLFGKPLQTEDWGGSTLADHHTFIVRYRPDEDRHLDMHVDECDVTFNFGLSTPGAFAGSDLAFCGMFADGNHRQHLHSYSHVKGRCVVHSGKRRHGALDIKEGERASLIMWTKSPQFRKTEAYRRMWGGGTARGKEEGPPDKVCLSETHDRDYSKWMRALTGGG